MQYDNTIIVFTSDHGDMLGGHGLATKGVGTSYEEVYNIPLIMRVPGIAARGGGHGHAGRAWSTWPRHCWTCAAPRPCPRPRAGACGPCWRARPIAADWQDAYAEFFGQRFVYTQRIVWHGNWKYVFSPGGIDELYAALLLKPAAVGQHDARPYSAAAFHGSRWGGEQDVGVGADLRPVARTASAACAVRGCSVQTRGMPR